MRVDEDPGAESSPLRLTHTLIAAEWIMAADSSIPLLIAQWVTLLSYMFVLSEATHKGLQPKMLL